MSPRPDSAHPAYPYLYKYGTRKHIEALTRFGTVWVGTLASYRAMERNGSMIPDKDEGRKILVE